MTFEINTLHRGRFIWILLGSLFVVGYLLSLTQLQEIYKIIILLFCIPAIMWAAVRFSKDSSTWSIQNRNINITIFNKELSFAVDEISYIKNHIRSGGNLVVFHKKGKSPATRIWRNKIFASNDQFDELIAALKALEIEILIG